MDLSRLSGLVSGGVAGGTLDGFKAVKLDKRILEAEKILRGALGFAASVTSGRKPGESCRNQEQHAPGCRCKALHRAKANELAEL